MKSSFQELMELVAKDIESKDEASLMRYWRSLSDCVSPLSGIAICSKR